MATNDGSRRSRSRFGGEDGVACTRGFSCVMTDPEQLEAQSKCVQIRQGQS